MKGNRLLLAFAALAACATCAAIAVTATPAAPIEAEASSREVTSGLFYKVESVGDIDVGDRVIFVSSGGHVMDDCWGNPGYLHGTRDGITRTHDGSLAFLQSCSATLWTVETGMVEQSYSFKGSMAAGGIYKEGVYLAQNTKEYYGTDTFGTMGQFFEDGFGLEVSRTNENSVYRGASNTNWYLSELDGGGITVKHVRPYNGQYGRLTFSPDLGFGQFLRTPNEYGHYPYITRQDVYIYKKIEQSETSSYSVGILQNMAKTSYVHGEEIDLSGLKLNLRITVQGSEVFDGDFAFKGNEKLFSYPKYAFGNGPATLDVTFAGNLFTRDIFVSRENESAAKVASSPHDYRGTYMLVAANDSKALRAKTMDIGTSTAVDAVDLKEVYGKPERKVAKDASDDAYLRFEVDRDGDIGFSYVLKCRTNGQYLCYGTYATLWDEENDYVRFNFEHNGTGIRIKATGNDEYLYYDVTHKYFQFGAEDAGMPVYLWKYGTSDDEMDGLNTFVKHFLEATDVCDAEGTVNRITKTAWHALRDEFRALSVEAQGILANLTYTPGEPQARSMEDMVNRYDYIVSKYRLFGDYEDPYEDVVEDFIHRLLAGTNPYPVSSLYASNRLGAAFAEHSTALFVAVLAGAGTLAVVVIVLMRKKRRNKA